MSDNVAAQRLLSGKAWDDFCETVRLTGHEIDRWGDVSNDLDRAAKHRAGMGFFRDRRPQLYGRLAEDI